MKKSASKKVLRLPLKDKEIKLVMNGLSRADREITQRRKQHQKEINMLERQLAIGCLIGAEVIVERLVKTGHLKGGLKTGQRIGFDHKKKQVLLISG